MNTYRVFAEKCTLMFLGARDPQKGLSQAKKNVSVVVKENASQHFSNQIVHTCTDSFPYISSVYVPELCNNLHHYVGFYVPTPK